MRFFLAQKKGVWQQIHARLKKKVRLGEGRTEIATAAIIDSPQALHGGKKIKGRKRHLLIDTMGLVVLIIVHAANIADVTASRMLPLKNQFEPNEYSTNLGFPSDIEAQNYNELLSCRQLNFEVVKRQSKQFKIFPRQWVVERTFALIAKQRRLSKDYERLPEVSETAIYIAMIRLMLNRLAA